MNATGDSKAELQDLTWTLLDEQATDSEIRRREQLLLASGEARGLYGGCAQMHADLYFLYVGKQMRLPNLTHIPLPLLPADSTTHPDSPAGSQTADC